MNDTVTIIVVDDSITYRQILQNVISKIAEAECIATAASGQIALRKIAELKPDLVLLDVVMPDMDGVVTLQQIKANYPTTEAIMISSFDMQNAKETLRSLQIGALDFIPKPKSTQPEQGINELVQYLRPLIHLLQTRKYARLSQRSILNGHRTAETQAIFSTSRSSSLPSMMSRRKIDLIVIGVSTGGPKALDQLIPNLPSSLPCPILIVQHMPPLFTESLALKLNEESHLTVVEAKGGEKLQTGHVYIAPGGKHLMLKAQSDGYYHLTLGDQAPVNNCRPSVDVLFQSIANCFKGRVLAVVMTGMGRDGTEGVRALKQKNCLCLIQDHDSSVVWGMPGSVYEAGLADEVVALNHLSIRIAQLAN